MGYAIFEVKRDQIGKIDQVIRDDIVSRQSIITRDAEALDVKKDVMYVKIEGNEEGIKRAEELFKEINVKKLPEKEAKEINEKMKSQDNDAAVGMGAIFG